MQATATTELHAALVPQHEQFAARPHYRQEWDDEVNAEPVPVPQHTDLYAMAPVLSKRTGVKADWLLAILAFHLSHSPPGYRQDLVQDIAMVWLDARPDNGRLAYGMAKKVLLMRWRSWHRREHRVAVCIDEVLEGDDRVNEDGMQADRGAVLASYIGAAVEFESMVIGQLDGQALWAKLPPDIRATVAKRMAGERVNGWPAKRLNAWAGTHFELLLQ